jgi:hypothetical protein
VGMFDAQPGIHEGSTGVTRVAARAHGRKFNVVAALLLTLAGCSAPAPAPPTAPPTAVPPASAAATPVATMRPEAATYWRQYCAAVAAWDRALDGAVAWSSKARLDPAMGREPDPEAAAAIEDMRTEIAGIATFPPVVPISRALEKAAVRMERILRLLGPVMADPTASSSELEQELPRLSADMASAAEFHRVAEGNYGRLDCPDHAGERVETPEGLVTVVLPDGWRLFGPSADDQARQLAELNPSYGSRLKDHVDILGPTGIVLYDAAQPGSSSVGAVVGLGLIPDATDLEGAMDAIEAALVAEVGPLNVTVKFLDRAAGDGARLISYSTQGKREQLIVDLVRVDPGLIFVLSRIPREDGPSYWLAFERILGSLRVDGAVDSPRAS